MNTFSPSTDVVLKFDMFDEETMEPVDPVSATFDLFDDEGDKLIDQDSVTVTGGEDSLSVTIGSTYNSMTETEGARTAVLYVMTAAGEVTFQKTYLLARFSFLQVPSESGMTLPQSEILSSKMAQSVLEVWDDAEPKRKSAGLREAWSRLSRIPYLPYKAFDDVPSTAPDKIIEGNFSIASLTKAEWDELPQEFRNALKRAQIIEAAVILDGDPTWDRRQDGLISKTVGESSEMFASKKAAFSTVSPKAYREISGYIRRTVRIGRA